MSMKRVFYEGRELCMTPNVKGAAYEFKNHCYTLHHGKFIGCKELEEDIDLMKTLCVREESNLKTQSYNTEIVVNEVDDWYTIFWKTQTEGNGNGTRARDESDD